MLADFAELHAFREISFNRLHATLNRRVINVAHDDFVTGSSRDLCDAMAHRAGAKHTDASNWASRSRVVVLVRVLVQRNHKAANQRWMPIQATMWLGPGWFD